MTFQEYIVNPMGRKNAVYSHREMYRAMYKEKLDKILVRENNKIKYFMYYTKDRYLIHIKVPSEVVPNFYYDTVIEFIGANHNLKECECNFYSNDPSFVYTFAYSFLKNQIFIRDLIPRMSKEAVNKAAVEKNPSNEIGYVKSIYFAYLIMERYKLFDSSVFKEQGKKYNKRELLNNIMKAEEKISLRKKEEEKLLIEKKKTNKEILQSRKRDIKNISTQTSINKVKTSSHSDIIKSSSFSKKSKYTKRY